MFHFNRRYLIASVLFSLIVPLFHINYHLWRYPELNFSADLLRATPLTALYKSDFSGKYFIAGMAVVGAVSFVLCLITILKIAWIFRIKKYAGYKKINHILFIETELEDAPFSFFNMMFWRSNISLNDENGKLMFDHEMAHIRGKHTYDKLFMQFIVCFAWINPFYWIIQKELILIHEYIADNAAIRTGDTSVLSKMLLYSFNKNGLLAQGSYFFQSPVRRRLMMLGAAPKSRSTLRRFAMIPVVFIIFIVFSSATTIEMLRDTTTAYVAQSQNEGEQLAAKHLAEALFSHLDYERYTLNGTAVPRSRVVSIQPALIKDVHVDNQNKTLTVTTR